MRGASTAARISITTTSTPRHATSMASVSPTGPAPTTSTRVSIVRPTDFPPGTGRPSPGTANVNASGQLLGRIEAGEGSARCVNPDFLNDAGELGALRLDEGREFGRRGSVGNLAKGRKTIGNGRLGRNRTDVARDAICQLPGHSARSEKTHQTFESKLGIAQLGRRRHIRD